MGPALDQCKDFTFHDDHWVKEQWKQLCIENATKNSKTIFDHTKDRYSLKLVFEHSRVKIEPESTYINANHILNKKYIAAQAPLPHTFSQFYDMIWQESVSVIVMLTKLEESDRCKAHRYWPTCCRPTIYVNDQESIVSNTIICFFNIVLIIL